MSEQNPSVDLDALLDSMKAAIAAQFPKLKTVEDYLRAQDVIDVPAVALEISDISQGDTDSGTGQLEAIITFTAYCIVSYKDTKAGKAKRRAVSLAAALMTFIKTQTWGAPIGGAKEIQAGPAFWKKQEKEETEYECWAVEWQHIARFGIDEWDEDGPMPREIYLGKVPNVGPDHIDDYWLIARDLSGEPPPETVEP